MRKDVIGGISSCFWRRLPSYPCISLAWTHAPATSLSGWEYCRCKLPPAHLWCAPSCRHGFAFQSEAIYILIE